MPASISVESGISAGTNYWIDRPVLRIGSDPQCEICLPTADLAPHALTLEYRDGNYRAYNRGTSPVTIGAAAVKPSASEIWRAEQMLQLPGDLRLLLKIDGDPRPTPRPDAWEGDDRAAEDEAANFGDTAGGAQTSAKKSTGTLVQLGVIGLCILGMVVFLTMEPNPDAASPDRPTFESLVETALSKEGRARTMLPRLQYAQAAVVRGHKELAQERFLKLRDQLVKLNESPSKEEQDNLQPMLQYVEYRLGLK